MSALLPVPDYHPSPPAPIRLDRAGGLPGEDPDLFYPPEGERGSNGNWSSPARLGTGAVASAWGGSPSEYRVDELDVVDDDDLGLIDVDDLCGFDDD